MNTQIESTKRTDPQTILDRVQSARLDMLEDEESGLDTKEKLLLMKDLTKTAVDEENVRARKQEVNSGDLIAAALATAIMSGTADNPFEVGTEVIGRVIEMPDDLLPDIEISEDEMSTELANITYSEIMEDSKS